MHLLATLALALPGGRFCAEASMEHHANTSSDRISLVTPGAFIRSPLQGGKEKTDVVSTHVLQRHLKWLNRPFDVIEPASCALLDPVGFFVNLRDVKSEIVKIIVDSPAACEFGEGNVMFKKCPRRP